MEEVSAVEGSLHSTVPPSSLCTLSRFPQVDSTWRTNEKWPQASTIHLCSMTTTPRHQVLPRLTLDYRLLESRDFDSDELCAHGRGQLVNIFTVILAQLPEPGSGYPVCYRICSLTYCKPWLHSPDSSDQWYLAPDRSIELGGRG